jgi:hypothetical protein
MGSSSLFFLLAYVGCGISIFQNLAAYEEYAYLPESNAVVDRSVADPQNLWRLPFSKRLEHAWIRECLDALRRLRRMCVRVPIPADDEANGFQQGFGAFVDLGPSLGNRRRDQKSYSGKNCCPFKVYMPMSDDLYPSGSPPASSLKLGVCSRDSPNLRSRQRASRPAHSQSI